MVMSLRLCLRRPNAGCMTWFSLRRENYAHTEAFTGSMRATEMEVEHDDTEPTRQTGRQPRPQVAREKRAEAETAAARTLADTRARAETGSAGAGEAAVEGCRVICGSTAVTMEGERRTVAREKAK